MKNFFSIIFVFIVGISAIGGACSQSHSFIDTAHAHASSMETQHDTEDFSDRETITKVHCCGEIRSDSLSNSANAAKSENTNSFTFTPDFGCNLDQSFSISRDSFDIKNRLLAASQFHSDPFLLKNVVKRE